MKGLISSIHSHKEYNMNNLSINTNIKLNNNDKLVAFADITINGLIRVFGLKLWNNNNSITVEFPSNKGSNGKKYPMFQFATVDMRDQIVQSVLSAYNNKINSQSLANSAQG